MSHADSLIINIAIADIHRLTARIFDVSNSLENTNFPIYERVCAIPPLYYMDWFKKYYPNAPLKRDNSPSFFQCMNKIQGIELVGQQWYRLIDAVVTIAKYKKITIDHVVYIKVFYNRTIYHLTVSTDYVLNNSNNET